PRVVRAEYASHSPAAHQSDLRTGELDRCHQRKRDQCCPERRVTELSSRHGIGADAGWIIVGGPGDEARSKHGQEPFNRVALWPGFLRETPRLSGWRGRGRAAGQGSLGVVVPVQGPSPLAASARTWPHFDFDMRLYFRIFLNSATRLMPRNLAVRTRW